VHGCRFVTQQLVPASPEVEHTVRDGSRYICVGLDALSAADELVEGVSLDLQQVIGKLRQATHTKYVPSVDFGANKVAVLRTLIQVSRAVLVIRRCRHTALPFVMLCVPCNPFYVIGQSCLGSFHLTPCTASVQ
jgi:hypothetical protein